MWRYIKDFEPVFREPEPLPQKIVRPPRGPRLLMEEYNYPPEYHMGHFERVRRLNRELLRLYRQIGKDTDELAEITEVYEFYGSAHLGSYYEDKIKDVSKKVRKSRAWAENLIAELNAIGVPPHIPDQLNLQVRNYVRPGTLAHLPGVNYYCSEAMEGYPIGTHNQRRLLRSIGFYVNRIDFLLECDKAPLLVDNPLCEGRVYAGLYKLLKEQYKKLEDSHFQMDLFPDLLDYAWWILAEEPEMVRAQRVQEEEREEEKQRRREEEMQRRRELQELQRRQSIFRDPTPKEQQEWEEWYLEEKKQQEKKQQEH